MSRLNPNPRRGAAQDQPGRFSQDRPGRFVQDRPGRFVQDRPGRWKLIARRWRGLKHQALAGCVIVGVLCLGGVAVHLFGHGANFSERLSAATASAGLRIDHIEIAGREKTPEPIVRAALGVRTGEPILGFSIAAARTRLETINWIQYATVERRLPDTIFVQLVERHPFAVWQHDGKFVLVDHNGAMVTDSDVATFADQLPLIVGTGAPDAAAALLDALAKQPDLQSRMVAAVRVGGRRWNLRMKNGADVMIAEGAEAPSLARLAQLQTDHALLDRPLQMIDLRLPDRLVVRPQPERPAADPGHLVASAGRRPT